MDPLEDSGFVAPALERDGAALGFGGSDYSFFGNLNDVDDALDGALEDGLEAPPEEELPDPDLLLEADEDLSYASMFATALKSPRDDADDASLTSKLHVELPSDAPPPKPKLGSIALGGLLTASTPTDAAFSAVPPSSTTSFTSATSAFATTPSSQPQLSTPQSTLNGISPPPQQQPSAAALTPQELEARLRGSTGAPQSPLPPHLQQGMPPYPPPPPYGQLPPPPHPYGMPPPGGMFPPQRPLIHQPGVFTPDMIMQQAQQQQQQQQGPMGGMPLPPHQQMPPMHQRPPPPPPLGQGPPRPPYPHHPPAHYQQQQQQNRYPRNQQGGGNMGHPAMQSTLAQRLRALNLADRPDIPKRVPLRKRYNSKMMSHDDIETILYMQWRPLHQGPPYIEDYYYQAFVYKHYGRRNKRTFAPESVRELAPTERAAEGDVAFVKLEGLGKVPFSNVRRPRPLMDLAANDSKNDDDGDNATTGKESSTTTATAYNNENDTTTTTTTTTTNNNNNNTIKPSRRLDQEPMLAARIMTEDCMALILDVQDIDRIFVAAAASEIENESALLQRRTLLMDGLAASLRLPETPSFSMSMQSGDNGQSDGVFLRLLRLPKGKTLAAKALATIYPPVECAKREKVDANLKLVWALLRHVRLLFEEHALTAAQQPQHTNSSTKNATTAISASNATSELYGSISKVALAMINVLKRLHDAGAVSDALSAIISGDLLPTNNTSGDDDAVLLPLFAPGEHAADTRYPWLAQVLIALLQRASEFELSSDSNAAAAKKSDGDEGVSAARTAWQEKFKSLYLSVIGHISALEAAAKEAKERGDVAVVEEIRSFVPVGLARSMMPLCDTEQGEKLKGMLVSLGV